MADPDFGSNVGQYPANVAGTLGQNSFLALGRVHIGTGGLPVPTRNFATGVATGLRTVYGFNGFGATLIGTGLYELSHPKVNIAAIFPQFVGQSGHAGNLTPQWSPGNSASGVARVQATRPQVAGSGALGISMPTGAANPSGFFMPFNPPSGTRFDVLFYVNPRNDQGITQY